MWSSLNTPCMYDISMHMCIFKHHKLHVLFYKQEYVYFTKFLLSMLAFISSCDVLKTMKMKML